MIEYESDIEDEKAFTLVWKDFEIRRTSTVGSEKKFYYELVKWNRDELGQKTTCFTILSWDFGSEPDIQLCGRRFFTEVADEDKLELLSIIEKADLVIEKLSENFD